MKLCAAVLFVFMLSSPAWTQTPEFSSTTADVVAWNFSGFRAIPLARQAQLARVLSDLDAEVVAAVEVNPDNVVHDVAAALTEEGACYDAIILDQTATQNIGVIYKCEVQVTNPRLVPDSDDGNPGLRKAFAVDVRMGQFDFVLMVLHLKSGRSSSARTTRNQQVPHIAAFVASAAAGGERDVLVVGDYNMIPGEDASNFTGLNPGGFLRFVSTEDLGGQFSHLSEGNDCDDGNLLDGFAVSEGHTGEYIEASLRIYPIHRALGISLCEFRNGVSDHLPLIARFRAAVDDDGEEGDITDGVRIVSLLPNPVDSDHHAEQVTLRNASTVDISLLGWRISDDDGNDFPLAGTIAASAMRAITLDRQAMLNNDGDEVRIASPSGLQHSVRYNLRVESGETLECNTQDECVRN